jgi:hypothetical protein
LDRFTAKEPIEILGLGRVPAEQTVVTQDPEIARLSHGSVRRCRHIIGIGKTLFDVSLE